MLNAGCTTTLVLALEFAAKDIASSHNISGPDSPSIHEFANATTAASAHSAVEILHRLLDKDVPAGIARLVEASLLRLHVVPRLCKLLEPIPPVMLTLGAEVKGSCTGFVT